MTARHCPNSPKIILMKPLLHLVHDNPNMFVTYSHFSTTGGAI
jgi:hypothetical protein